jgi:hypothetical protein
MSSLVFTSIIYLPRLWNGERTDRTIRAALISVAHMVDAILPACID